MAAYIRPRGQAWDAKFKGADSGAGEGGTELLISAVPCERTKRAFSRDGRIDGKRWFSAYKAWPKEVQGMGRKFQVMARQNIVGRG